MILTDAGPLVALIHRGDRHHAACKQAFQDLGEPMGTVWPAFTEAMYLLGFSSQAQSALFGLVHRGALSFFPLDEADTPRMQALMEQYRDLPMDLADAALVRVAERENLRRIFTLDRRDFQVYRPKGSTPFELFPTQLSG